MRRVLIVEDDEEIAKLVQLHLKDANCAVDIAGYGQTALTLFSRQAYDIVVLDLNLPDTDGLTVCRELRKHSSYVPILMLTAKSTELDRVLGLEIGADDYLTKPFSFPELVARIKALLRRVEALAKQPAEKNEDAEAAVLRFADLEIDAVKRQVMRGDQMLDLTAKEFDLLIHFARHPGRVFNRAQLLDQVWGYGHDGYEHTVNSHINRLRAKLETNPAEPRFILTVWGVGYKFADR